MDSWLADCVFYDAYDIEVHDAGGGGGGGSSNYLFITTYFDGKVVAETDKAYLINSITFNNASLWIPKSQIESSYDTEDGLTNFGIPRWLYDKKVIEGQSELAVEAIYKTVECYVMAQTSLAWLLKLENMEFWTPITQMKSRKFDRTKNKWIIEVTDWILNKNTKEKELKEDEHKIACEKFRFPFRNTQKY